MNSAEWKISVQKKIYFMTKNIWDGLRQNEVDTFLSNFKRNEEVGLALMEMLIFYSLEQEVLLASAAFKQFKRQIWLKTFINNGEKRDSCYINKYFHAFFKDTCFVPLEETDPSGSAFSIANIYKRVKKFPKEIEFVNIQDVPLMIALRKKCIVLYDDVIGTGTQFSTFWNDTNHFGRNKVSLNMLAQKNKDVQFYYLVFGANKNKLEELSKKFPNIVILTAEQYEPEDSVLNENNEYWEFNPQLKDKVIEYVSNKILELKINNEFGSNIPVLFQHCRAQNTSLPLYWVNKPGNWKELYKR